VIALINYHPESNIQKFLIPVTKTNFQTPWKNTVLLFTLQNKVLLNGIIRLISASIWAYLIWQLYMKRCLYSVR